MSTLEAEAPLAQPHGHAHGPSCGHDHGPGPGWSGEEVLTPGERRAVVRQVVPLLLGGGLLLLGLGYAWRFPSQAPIAASIQAAAAACVGLPLLARAARGFLARPSHSITEQLVGLAILAAAGTGDFLTATLVPLFLELGHLFEERSARGARAAIDGIRGLAVRTARVLDTDGEHDQELEHIAVGTRVLVRPGETVPVDGEVLVGRASIDSSAVTGESAFEEVGPGDPVFAGTVDIDGLLEVRTTRVGRDSTLGRVVGLLEQVEATKTPILRLIEKYAGTYLPLVLAVAGTALAWTGELERAIAILIVACPCALVIAGPAAMVAALTAASRSRAQIKSAEFLERAGEVRVLVLDKTGTVTSGEAGVCALEPADDRVDADRLLALAAACGRGSLHPVSRAAVAEADARGLEPTTVETVREHAGEGVVATVDGRELTLGNPRFLEQRGVALPSDLDRERQGAWLAEDGHLLGFVGLADAARPEARAALKALRQLGLERLVLLTGDRRATAERIGAELGFDEVVSEVLPEQKLDVVRAEQTRGPVMMVGDGVNDALALSGADVGVAIGARVSDVALGGADVALLGGDLRALPSLLELAARTRWTVVQNAALGTGLSLAMMALASVGLIGPLLGAALHNVGSLAVILNSSRLVPRELEQ
ncbi:MAG: cation-translocating P-type ATPase [Planctomycetota bacterium]